MAATSSPSSRRSIRKRPHEHTGTALAAEHPAVRFSTLIGGTMRLFPIVVSGVLAVSFSQLAAAQASVQGPAGTGASVDLNKGPNVNVSPDVQNSQQVGQGNQANQQQGSGNQAQNTQQSGSQNQNSQQYGQSSSSQQQ